MLGTRGSVLKVLVYLGCNCEVPVGITRSGPRVQNAAPGVGPVTSCALASKVCKRIAFAPLCLRVLFDRSWGHHAILLGCRQSSECVLAAFVRFRATKKCRSILRV